MIEYFGITRNTKTFIEMFFGYPNKEKKSIVKKENPGIKLSREEIRRNRVFAGNIPLNIRNSAISWFNNNKMDVFDVIVKKGMNNTPVNRMIWHTKKDDMYQVLEIKDIRRMAAKGRWQFSDAGTVMDYRVGGRKLFHLQMKGSGGGGAGSSAYHAMQFHIHKLVTEA